MTNKKLEAWADKLLDTGKRNNLISFKDTKASTAEILVPDCESVFSKCAVGRVFEVIDPKMPDEDLETEFDGVNTKSEKEEHLTRAEYKERYSFLVRNDKAVLVYAHTPNPMKAVKSIAKKSKERLDETGINVAYLAFGFLRWNEREDSEVFYKAPLLLVHVNIITGTVLEPIRIEISDDDVVVNPTFSYYLQATYGLSLPEYEDGTTLSEYLSTVSSIVSKMKWQIISECKLGIFSFLKINMYEDLKKNEDLILSNSNVRKLLGEKNEAEKTLDTVVAGDDKAFANPLIDLHTVVDADSSQIEAIEMAKSGKSFVLQGPPGTGKSQTITNIIAECLYDGKKVLFVSEKQAALNVVYDKLKKAGLADFCLELHSHKANKKAVIEELNRTLTVPKSGVSSSAEEEIRQKQYALSKLDAYESALHKVRKPIGRSLYQLFELHAEYRSFPDIKIRVPEIQKRANEYLLQMIRLLEQYADFVPSIGKNYRENSWFGFVNMQISFDERALLHQDLGILVSGYSNLRSEMATIQKKYALPESNYSETVRWQKVLSLLAESDVITPRFLDWNEFSEAVSHVAAMKELSKTIVPTRNRIFELFDSGILTGIDGKEYYTKLTNEFQSVFTRAFSREYKRIIASLQSYLRAEDKIKYQHAVNLLNELMTLQSAQAAYNENEKAIQGFIGKCYQGPDTDWTHVETTLDELRAYFCEGDSTLGILSRMSDEVYQKSIPAFGEEAGKLEKLIVSVDDAKNRVNCAFSDEVLDLDKDRYDYSIHKLEKCYAEFDRLGNWISFSSLLSQMASVGLSQSVDVIIESGIEANQISGAYRRAFYQQWIEYVLFADADLVSFSRSAQDQAVRIFNEKDKLQYEISKVQIKSVLSRKRPDIEIIAGGSAVSTLRREGAKKRKQMPIRRLLSEVGALVQILKPCFLMSPLSVSTFLEPEKISFDTIVFDEASQIFPQDAVGAIYRGKQLIVVGDSKQMPPSNFFSSSMDSDDDEEEVGDVNDFESILDICSVAFTTERLAWHYRSHYEQLIAFSNLHFYKNSLITFPSATAKRKGIGVDFFHVDGVFDRKSKTNKAEAQFIVDLVYQNIKEYPNRSLGVVAFSVAQQNLIDLLLQKRRAEDTSYEWFFSEENPEPFFVKNLETVQGDERDTIIFSVAYAKDSLGRFIHNFGPLNREGGERRLNVAVTRAKDNVQLVSSIRYTDINLNNTESEGARLLRAYLDYAENGEQALEQFLNVSDEDSFDSAFEMEICDFLRDQEFTVDTQIGCSGYKIDLGVRRPDGSDYLMAIECDGATYHMSKNARDRDSLRQHVLENMGWHFYRIWSTDWYRNKPVEKERLLNAIRSAMGIKQENSEDRKEQQVAAEAIQERFAVELNQSTLDFKEYHEIDTYTMRNELNADFQGAIKRILLEEAPLSEDYLLKRLAWFFGREKVTSVVSTQYSLKMFGCDSRGIKRTNGFLYLSDMKAVKLRVPGDKRDIKYISIVELADGLNVLLQQNITATRDGLYKSMINLLGFNRAGDTITYRFGKAIDLLKQKGVVKEEDGVLQSVEQIPTNSERKGILFEESDFAHEIPQYAVFDEKIYEEANKTVQALQESMKGAFDFWLDDSLGSDTIEDTDDEEDEDDDEDIVEDDEDDEDEYSFEEAQNSIRDYLKDESCSRSGLIDSLKGDGFSAEIATQAVDSFGINWVEQAIAFAKENTDGFTYSRQDLIDELEFEGFTENEAEIAANHVDWVAKAMENAAEYLESEPCSRKGLIDYLVLYDFTPEEATRAVDGMSIDWNEQAVKKAQEHADYADYTREEMIEELMGDGFTRMQAIYGVRNM